MPDTDFLCFSVLKKELARKLQEKYPEVDHDISSWKGKEIKLFQDALEEHVNGRISEKSFYTYFKNDSQSLPRIDVLDLLCSYVGYENWMVFKLKFQKSSKHHVFKKIGVGLGVGVIVVLLFFIWLRPKTYTISVIDAYSSQIIPADRLKVSQIFDEQSPMEIGEIDDSIYTFYTDGSKVRFVLEAPYFHVDTILRKVGIFSQHEYIRLFPNDYAIMIHSLSVSENEDWNRRRAQLSTMIDDNARIFQLNPEGFIAIEMYNKHEFINKLTIPVNSLKNIEIIDIKYKNDMISELRFIQQKGGSYE